MAHLRIGPGLGIQIDEEVVRKASEAYKRPWRQGEARGKDGAVQEW